MSELLLRLAVDRETVGRNRKTLYSLRQKLQEFASSQQHQAEEGEGEEEEEEVMDTLDQSDEGIVSHIGHMMSHMTSSQSL